MQCQLAFSPLVNSTLGLLLCLLVALGGPAVALAALCLRLQRGKRRAGLGA